MYDALIEDGWSELRRTLQAFKDNWIREAAYFKWLAAGSPEGDGVYFWLAAEQDYIIEASKIPEVIELPKIPDFPPIIIDRIPDQDIVIPPIICQIPDIPSRIY